MKKHPLSRIAPLFALLLTALLLSACSGTASVSTTGGMTTINPAESTSTAPAGPDDTGRPPISSSDGNTPTTTPSRGDTDPKTTDTEPGKNPPATTQKQPTDTKTPPVTDKPPVTTAEGGVITEPRTTEQPTTTVSIEVQPSGTLPHVPWSQP